MHLEMQGVTQSYGDGAVLDDISLSLEAGRIGCLLGQSGCGKTTVLRCIAGFEEVRGGSISIGGEVLSGPGVHVAPENRGVGMVFQHYALFPHLTVAGNVAFGLRELSRGERESRVREILDVTGMTDAADAWPDALSGGQRQRVALARALAPQPGLLLLDEPFSNLDQDLRYRLNAQVRQILRKTGATALLVTHDQHEAFAVADEVAVMNGGRIEQWGSPHDLYHRPRTRFVATFIGRGALLTGQLREGGDVQLEIGVVRAELAGPAEAGARVQVLLRPDDIAYDGASATTANVRSKDFRGATILYTLALESGAEVLAAVPSQHDFSRGDEIGIRLCAQRAAAFAD